MTRNRKPSPTLTHSIRAIGGAYQVVGKLGSLVASITACATYQDALAALSHVNR